MIYYVNNLLVDKICKIKKQACIDKHHSMPV